MAKTYPMPGTHAERILNLIVANPGITANGIITALSMNASPARKCLTALQSRGLIVDQPDGEGNHHYSAKVPAL